MSKIGNNKVNRAIVQQATGWTPVNGGNGHTTAATASVGEATLAVDEVRAQHQAYLEARHRYGVMPVILVPADDKFVIFEEDVYTAAQYVQVAVILSLHHHAVIDQAAVGKLQAAGFQIVYANQTGGTRER